MQLNEIRKKIYEQKENVNKDIKNIKKNQINSGVEELKNWTKKFTTEF